MGQMEPLGPPPSPFEGPTANKMKDRLDLHNNTRNVLTNAGQRTATKLMGSSEPPDPRDARIRGLENDVAQLKADAARLKAALDQLAAAAPKQPGDAGGGYFSGIGNTLSGWGTSLSNYFNPPAPVPNSTGPDVPKMNGVDDSWGSYVSGPRSPMAKFWNNVPWWLSGNAVNSRQPYDPHTFYPSQ